MQTLDIDCVGEILHRCNSVVFPSCSWCRLIKTKHQERWFCSEIVMLRTFCALVQMGAIRWMRETAVAWNAVKCMRYEFVLLLSTIFRFLARFFSKNFELSCLHMPVLQRHKGQINSVNLYVSSRCKFSTAIKYIDYKRIVLSISHRIFMHNLGICMTFMLVQPHTAFAQLSNGLNVCLRIYKNSHEYWSSDLQALAIWTVLTLF